MKLFTKLALVSSIAISANAMAMQAMDDASLSSTTGQDGLNIGIAISKVSIDKLNVFDGDGLQGTQVLPTGATGASVGGTGQAGAIQLTNVVIAAPLKNGALDTTRTLDSHNLVDLAIDTDGNNGSPFLNVAAAVSGLDISLGPIYVTTADNTASADGFYTAGDTGKAQILNGLNLKTGKTSANIQLGNTPQGAMIKLAGTMQGGLDITDLSLHDASLAGGGDIVLGRIHLNDSGSADLSTNADIAVRANGVNGATQDGLQITAMKTATDVYVQSIKLGSAAANSIGDVQVQGMKVWNGAAGLAPASAGIAPNGAVITITGH